jgi:hypothetical protein
VLTVEAKQHPSADLAVFRRTHAGTRRQTTPPKQQPACEHEPDAVGAHRIDDRLELAGEARDHEATRVVRVRGGEWSGPEPDRFRPIAGEGDPSRVAAGEGDSPQAAAGEKDDPKISVKQAAKELTTTGSAEFKVQWSVSDEKANGWIIQHVKFSGSKKDCDGKDVATNTTGEEYWEGWQVRDGRVYVGSSDSRHVADTFRTADEGATTGTLVISGKVTYMPGYELKEPPWGHDVAAAGSLPTMKVAPKGWDDGAAKDHKMTVKWDACAKAATHSVTTTP